MGLTNFVFRPRTNSMVQGPSFPPVKGNRILSQHSGISSVMERVAGESWPFPQEFIPDCVKQVYTVTGPPDLRRVQQQLITLLEGRPQPRTGIEGMQYNFNSRQHPCRCRPFWTWQSHQGILDSKIDLMHSAMSLHSKPSCNYSSLLQL